MDYSYSRKAWSTAIDRIVAELHAACELVAPPFDALQIAGRLGFVVAVDARQNGRGRCALLPGGEADVEHVGRDEFEPPVGLFDRGDGAEPVDGGISPVAAAARPTGAASPAAWVSALPGGPERPWALHGWRGGAGSAQCAGARAARLVSAQLRPGFFAGAARRFFLPGSARRLGSIRGPSDQMNAWRMERTARRERAR